MCSFQIDENILNCFEVSQCNFLLLWLIVCVCCRILNIMSLKKMPPHVFLVPLRNRDGPMHAQSNWLRGWFMVSYPYNWPGCTAVGSFNPYFWFFSYQLQLRVQRMVLSSQLWGPLTGLDPEWISYLALMVQVRVFRGFWHALVMYDLFFLCFSLSLVVLFFVVTMSFILPVTESPASWATQACGWWWIPENFRLYQGCNWSCFTDDCKCDLLLPFCTYTPCLKKMAKV